ncbi:MAG: phosphatidate cytidylyltransferase, partial [Spirochaetia bacterium]|nr:phosphatidate cytidylyltransferase [Spirochaetia bacterium]
MNETVKRILSAAVLVAISVTALVFSDRFYWLLPLLLVYAISVLGLLEFYILSDRGVDGRPIRYIGILFVSLITLAFYARLLNLQKNFVLGDLPETLQVFARFGIDGTFITFVFFLMVLTVLSHQLFFRPISGSIYSISTTVTGVFYTSLPILHIILYLSFENKYFYVVFFILVTAMTDSGAYFAGKFLGKHNAGLRVSPRKTIEGYAGGIITAVITGFAFNIIWEHFFNFRGFSHVEVILLSFFLALISIVGDLVESVFKRDANKKDSASFIPGHGG